MVQKKVVKNQQSKWVPIKFNVPDNIITRFTTNMTVQIIGNEFKISFFEQFPPIILQDEQPPKEIQANCVASVIVTADRLPKFIKALQDQLDLLNTRNKSNKPLAKLS